MPLANPIRKQMLWGLENGILPALRSQIVPQLFAGPPFDFAGWPTETVRERPLPNRKSHPLDVIVRWEKEQISAVRMSRLSFVYGGASDERIGLARAMDKAVPVGDKVAGITKVRFLAPAAFYIPAHVPHSGSPFDEELYRQYGPLRILVLQFTGRELRLRHFDQDLGGSHHLSVSDPRFNELEARYVVALRGGEMSAAQAHLLALMSCLREHLSQRSVTVSNSAWPQFERSDPFHSQLGSPRSVEICSMTIDYIQFHLHEPLTGQELAKISGVTYVHLNRVFKEVTGETVMSYVTACRIRAAEMILVQTQERVGDVTKLVGFSSLQSFSAVFAKQTGLSPRQYRRVHSNPDCLET